MIVRVILSGTVETFDADAFTSQLAGVLGVTVDEISLAVSAASVRVVATVRPDAAADNDDATAAAAVESVRAAAEALVLRPADEISTILNVTVEEIEQPEVQTVLLPAPPIVPPPPGVAATPPPRPPTGDHEDGIADDESLVSTGGGSDAGAIAGGVLGGLAAVVLLGAAAFVYQRRVAAQRSPEHLAQSVTGASGASGGGADKKLSVVAVHLDLDSALPQPPDIPDEKPTTEGAAPPQSLPALLAACGLEHHRSAFEAERYTLENLLSVMKQGDEAAIRDLRELKLNLEECRKFITQLKKTSWV